MDDITRKGILWSWQYAFSSPGGLQVDAMQYLGSLESRIAFADKACGPKLAKNTRVKYKTQSYSFLS